MSAATSHTHDRGGPAAPVPAGLRLLNRISDALGLCGSVLIGLIMALICADILLRFAISAPITGVVEMVSFSIIAIVFLQLADAIRHDRLTRADSLLNHFQTRRPAVVHAINAVSALFGMAILLIMLSRFLPQTFTDYQRGYYLGTQGLFTLPMWPLRATVSLSLGVAIAQLLATFVTNILRMMRRKEKV